MYKGKNDRCEPVRKKNGPSPGGYDTQTSFYKTQISFSNVKFGIDKKGSFVDAIKKASKKVPGVGTYKNIDRAYDKLSKSPRNSRSTRK